MLTINLWRAVGCRFNFCVYLFGMHCYYIFLTTFVSAQWYETTRVNLESPFYAGQLRMCEYSDQGYQRSPQSPQELFKNEVYGVISGPRMPHLSKFVLSCKDLYSTVKYWTGL